MKISLLNCLVKRQLLFLLLTLAGSGLHAQILTNGDFESGGSGLGFMVHDYTVINPVTGTSTPGFYARTTDPSLMNAAFQSGGDHTTGTGNMLVFDGSLLSNRFFWTTGNTGGAINGFTAGTTYTFRFWIKSVSDEVTSDDATRASIGLFFVNAANINPANQNFLAPLPSQGWVQVQYSFVATADNAMVRLKTNNPGPVGNDFAIDDFSITEGGLPFAGSFTFNNPTCPSGTDGSISVNLTGGTLPYSLYTLTGSATQTSTNGMFSGLGEGTYQVSVSDASGQQYTQDAIVLAAPNDFQLSPAVSICEGDSTVLAASGGAGTYLWTANPPDASISNPANASQTVSPLVTTTYTVTSGSVSSNVNLIPNGDFSQGDSGFTTQYSYIANPNPFGVQASYSIVTNPNSWFTPFSSCGDNTTGSGNLMVFDGSVDPTGNVVAWNNLAPAVVLPNTNYTFSYYVASVSPENPARLEVTINGISQGQPVLAPGATCLWTQVSYNWNSGSDTTANIAIYDRNFASGGNDFALDDIVLREATTCVYQDSVTVTVTPGTIPVFDAIADICQGGNLSALPAVDTNGISGSWSPALNNMATTTYVFTPDAGQCAASANITITVNSQTTPDFTQIEPICSGETANPLLAISNNGIAGVWSPAWNLSETTTYEFTPAAGQCAVSVTMTVSVISAPDVAVSQGCEGVRYTLHANQDDDVNATYAWFNAQGTQLGAESSLVIQATGVYELVITSNGCSFPTSVTVNSVACQLQKGISANNDGANDSFDLAGYNVTHLRIFNRYGTNVYSKADYRNEWYGQSDNGNELPDGTYYYTIDFSDLKTKTGWIYVNRVQ